MRKTSILIKIAFSLLTLLTYGNEQVYSQNNGKSEKYIKNLPFDMPIVKVPVFPKDTVYITDFGAVSDGQTKNTEAINKAINFCASKGGGTVVIPAGLWLTGPIELKSDINLHAKRGALIIFSQDHKDYPVIKKGNSISVTCPIYGTKLTNIAITGEGIFDGSGETWRPVKKSKTTESQWKNLLSRGGFVDKNDIYWPTLDAMNGASYEKELKKKGKNAITEEDYEKLRDYKRPYMMVFSKCKNVLLDGPTFQNSPKFVFKPYGCENMIIRNIKVFNEWWAQNGDGIDISGGKNVIISNCTVSVGDDGICMKSSKNKSAGENTFLQNILIYDCVVYHGHGGFVIGSNTDGGMKNIYVANCNFNYTDIGLRFKSSRGRGGLVENIYVKDIFMKDIADEAILFNTYYENKNADPDEKHEVDELTPCFKNFHIENIYCNGAEQAIKITGLPEMPIQNINFNNIVISSKYGFTAYNSKNITLNNVRLIPQKGIPYSIEKSEDLYFKNIKLSGGLIPPFMEISGSEAKNINVENKYSKNQDNFIFKKGANRNAVIYSK